MRRLAPTAAVALLAPLVGCGDAPPPDAGEVVRQLEGRGVPIGEVEVYNEDSDPNELLGRPGQYVGKANFELAGLKSDGERGIDTSEGGSVETFASEGEAEKRASYLETVSESGPLFTEYDYREGRVVLRLAGKLAPRKARRYGGMLPAG